jgi:hypothetical protein
MVSRASLAAAFIVVLLAALIVDTYAMESIGPSAIGYTRVRLNGERVMQSGVAAADFDGDGDKELVVGGRDGRLHVVAYQNGSWSEVWWRQTADDLNAAGAPSGSPCVPNVSDIRSSPAVADLDGDGHLEIVVTTGGDPAQHRNGGVLVYRYGGSSPWSFELVPNWPQPRIDQVGLGAGSSYPDGCWDGIWNSPALGDLDGDGDLEVVIEGFDRRIHAWHHDGSVVAGWPIYRYNGDNILRGGWGAPALGDIDGDGLPEVVVGTDSPPWGGPGSPAPDYSKATVWAINGDSTNVPGWPVTTDNNIQSSPALGDVDGDGALEVVVGSGVSVEGGNGHRVYVWNGDGSAVSGWPLSTDGDMPAPPALGDLDGDGDLEIVIGCGTAADTSCRKLYAWHANGQPVSDFPVEPPFNSWYQQTSSMPFSPVLADFDGDGAVEILIVHRDAFGITTVDGDGTWAHDLERTNYTLMSSPLVDDVDGDDGLEVVLAGAYQESSDGYGGLYIWEVGGDTEDALPWPMFHHDARRTGRYAMPPSLGFPDDVVLLHQEGSGDTETTAVRVWNEGEGSFDWEVTHGIARLNVAPSSGTVHTSASMQFTVSTDGLSTGWHDLGRVTVTGTNGGQAIDGSPQTATVRIYVGEVERAYLPLVARDS